MVRNTTIAALALTSSLFVACADLDAPGLADGLAADAGVNQQWLRVPTPTDAELRAIHGTRVSDLWAVGDRGVILHFDGLEWSIAHTPANYALNAVWVTEGAGWAVGDLGTLLRLDRGFWYRVELETSAHLRAVWGSSPADVWVVGDDGTMLRFDGKAWRSQQAPNGLSLYALWGTSARDVYAAGVGEVLHYDGRGWSPSHSSGFMTFVDIWGSSASDVWVVTDRSDLRRFDGAGWREIPTDDTGLVGERRSIWTGAPDDVWAIGVDPEGGSGIVHYDGDRWSVSYTDPELRLDRIWGIGADLWAVGGGGTILRRGR